jgi:hypothetical protein
MQKFKENVDHLSRTLSKELRWKVNGGSEYDKVAGIFALNTVCNPCLVRETFVRVVLTRTQD